MFCCVFLSFIPFVCDEMNQIFGGTTSLLPLIIRDIQVCFIFVFCTFLCDLCMFCCVFLFYPLCVKMNQIELKGMMITMK